MISALPILFVTNMDTTIRFFEALGFETDTRSRSEKWTELRAGHSRLALHLDDEARPTGERPRLALNFEADEPLETIVRAAERAGIQPSRGIVDEGWGRSVHFRDPDGLEFGVHEHDRSLYT